MSWNLPTLAEQSAKLAFRPQPKGASRLEKLKAETKLIVVDEAAFKAIVRKRDRLRCRKCGRKVVVQMARGVKRCEVHHLYGRRGDMKFDDRFAICVCGECHEQLTGRVNEKWITVGTMFLDVKGHQLIDARHPVLFERVC